MSETLVLSPDDVFINCPFDGDYAPTFEALIFTVFACGFRPRSARELEDGSQTRIDKLYTIIEQCRFGVHDLSRTELDAATSCRGSTCRWSWGSSSAPNATESRNSARNAA